MSEFERRVGEAADFVVDKLDGVVDGASTLLSGENGRKLAGGAAVGALAAVVLPVTLPVGALLGAGYAAFRVLGRGPRHDGHDHGRERGHEAPFDVHGDRRD